MTKKKLQFQLPLLLFSLLTNKTVLTNIKSWELHDIAVIVTLYPSKIITSCHVTVEICFLLTNLNWLIYILPAGWLWSKSRTGWICVNVGFYTYGIGRFLEFCYQYIGNITADMFSISTIISGFWEYWWGNSSNCKIHANQTKTAEMLNQFFSTVGGAASTTTTQRRPPTHSLSVSPGQVKKWLKEINTKKANCSSDCPS